MFELEQDKFGEFLRALRKEKGYTQKELAQKLLVSDKAVSKWECGKSMPDISLLIPLAGLLGVTVTELLEGKRLEPEMELEPVRVEKLVKRALSYSEEALERPVEQRRKNILVFGAGALALLLELLLLRQILGEGFAFDTLTDFFTLEMLCVIFGGYFWLFAKEKLPVFYDENKICFYSDGAFRMNIPGLHFNNSNWNHVLRACRCGLLGYQILAPLLLLMIRLLLPEEWHRPGQWILFLLFFCAVFLPAYVVGKKYE